MLISAPSLGVYYCQQLTLSVCSSVTKLQIASFFVSRFLAVSSSWPLYKMFFFDFWFRPPKFTPQNLHKITYKSACMADRPEMFGPTRGVFRDGRFNGTMQNVLGHRGVQRHTRLHKMRHRNPWGKNMEVGGGTKFTVYHFVLRGNKRIKPITEILGDRNKEVGGNTVLGHSAVSLPFQ